MPTPQRRRAELDVEDDEELELAELRPLEPDDDDDDEARGALLDEEDRDLEEDPYDLGADRLEPDELGAPRYDPPEGRDELLGTIPDRLEPARPDGVDLGTTTGDRPDGALRDE